jgi:hypothetical protein
VGVRDAALYDAAAALLIVSSKTDHLQLAMDDHPPGRREPGSTSLNAKGKRHPADGYRSADITARNLLLRLRWDNGGVVHEKRVMHPTNSDTQGLGN